MSEGLRERMIAAVGATYDLYEELLEEKECSIAKLEGRVGDLESEVARLSERLKAHAELIHQIVDKLFKAENV